MIFHKDESSAKGRWIIEEGAKLLASWLLAFIRADDTACFPSHFPVTLLEQEWRSLFMAYWLLKSEPSVYSFADLDHDKGTTWDGVTNNTALMHLRAMKQGDLAFIYHSGNEKSIVGIAELTSGPYPNPRLNDPRQVVVDLKPVRRVKRPITLAAIKAKKEFSDFALVRIPRLSVVPVTAQQWKALLTLSD